MLLFTIPDESSNLIYSQTLFSSQEGCYLVNWCFRLHGSVLKFSAWLLWWTRLWTSVPVGSEVTHQYWGSWLEHFKLPERAGNKQWLYLHVFPCQSMSIRLEIAWHSMSIYNILRIPKKKKPPRSRDVAWQRLWVWTVISKMHCSEFGEGN